ncbi:sigma-E factor negative regulatory protein [Craterilacuibacter sinensis]|uniref:Anti-sigma 24 factor n=1 Tax=Craterilacuibacter sinensis TaxID=2686017 RepID=A0A845BRE9_9NEIS|nr:RseA family anti-sigma factor [Craterilacuibacter sinensis]MXR36796.1 anti-sigma 24 factor [Craterilacuibacter sinensis]
MKENISALMDDALDDAAAHAAITDLQADKTLKDSWDTYQLIGDAMRGGGGLALDVRREVSERLRDEPTVLAPARRWPLPARKLRHYALAASLACAAVVGWMGWQQDESEMVVAKASEAQVFSPVTAVEAPYLLAHQEMAGTIDSSQRRVAYVPARDKAAH